MSEIILKANINECTVENWQTNTGEVNARELKVEMSEDLFGCDNQFVTFELADGTVYESKVNDGKAKIPIFDKSQFIKIGLYAENIDGEKRYSSRSANVYVNMGSYPDGPTKPPIPTPGDYAALLKEIAGVKEYTDEALSNIEQGGIKVFDEKINIWELETGIYYLNSGFNFTSTEIIEAGKHILIIYKPQPTTKAVRYIHFCNTTSSSDWFPVECGYTNGTTRKEYDIIDTSNVTGDILSDVVGNKIPNTAGVKAYVKDYVNEQLGVIDNGLY